MGMGSGEDLKFKNLCKELWLPFLISLIMWLVIIAVFVVLIKVVI